MTTYRDPFKFGPVLDMDDLSGADAEQVILKPIYQELAFLLRGKIRVRVASVCRAKQQLTIEWKYESDA